MTTEDAKKEAASKVRYAANALRETANECAKLGLTVDVSISPILFDMYGNAREYLSSVNVYERKPDVYY